MATAILTTYNAKAAWSQGLYSSPLGGQYSPLMVDGGGVYSGGNYTDGFSEPQTTGLQFSDPGNLIPIGSTITQVVFTVNHNVSAINVFTPISGLREDDTSSNGYLQYFDGFFNTHLNTLYPTMTQWSFTVSAMPDGSPWDLTNLFTRLFLVASLANNPVPPPGTQTYRVGQLASSGPPVASFFAAGFLTVTYTPPIPPPPPVVVTGSGGLSLGGSARTFGAGTGPAAELHLNQWGLEAFMLDTDLNEHLG